MNILMGLLSISFSLYANNGSECRYNEATLLKSEQSILNSLGRQNSDLHVVWPKLEPTFTCIQKIAQNAEFPLNVHASSFLRTLLSGKQVDGLEIDGRYSVISKLIAQQLSKETNILLNPFIANQANAEWTFYKNFCTPDQQIVCIGLLPDKDDILNLVENIAVGQALMLKNSLVYLNEENRQKVMSQLELLHLEVPASKMLLRRMLEQIRQELIDSNIPMSLLTGRSVYISDRI